MPHDLFARLSSLAREFRGSLRNRSPLPISNFPAGADLATYDPHTPRPLSDLVDATAGWMEQGILQCTHPRYFGLFNPSVHFSSIMADALAALYNPQVGGWTHAPAANEIEQWTLRTLGATLGWTGDFAAHFTSGGSEANHTAVIAALTRALPGFKADGAGAGERAPRIYLSEESHHSFVKIARACGIGERALVRVETDASFRLVPAALRAAMERDAGHSIPVLVVATAGTTGSGAIDPLPAIAELARAHGTWLHVDAAWGGAAALVPQLRPLLDGIELADSVTWDAHKWLSVSMGAGMLYCRDRAALQDAFDVSTGYVPPTVPGGTDLYKEGLQWSRRFIGLKVFFAIAEHGLDGLGRMVQHQADMAERLRERLRRSGWSVVNETRLPLVCFSHERIDGHRLTSDAVVQRVLARGRCWISRVTLPRGVEALRACITSFDTSEPDLDILLEDLTAAVA